MDGMDGMDRVDRIGKPAMLVLVAVAMAGCYEVGPLSSGSGAPDADSDSDSDTDWPILEGGFSQDITFSSGCGDVYMYGSGPYGEGEVALFFQTADRWALEMYESGEDSWSEVFVLPTAAIDLTAQLGLDLTAYACNDVMQDEPEVWRTYSAISGVATLNLTATSDEWSEWNVPAHASLYLSDVVFAPSDGGPGAPVPLGELLMAGDTNVGWFPG
jgi:hypothetical protein